MNKNYVQFSKKIVVSVTSAVTAVVIAGIIMAFLSKQIDQITAMVRIYVEYAMVVFAAYSGNSAVEKWLIHRAGKTDTDENKQTEPDNG